MTFDYDEILTVINEVIPEFGVECSAVLESEGDYDPETGVSSTRLDTKGFAVITNFNLRDSDQNNLIEAGDKILLAMPSLKLEKGSIVTVNSEEWQVENPNPIQPASTIVLYKAHVRRI